MTGWEERRSQADGWSLERQSQLTHTNTHMVLEMSSLCWQNWSILFFTKFTEISKNLFCYKQKSNTGESPLGNYGNSVTWY